MLLVDCDEVLWVEECGDVGLLVGGEGERVGGFRVGLGLGLFEEGHVPARCWGVVLTMLHIKPPVPLIPPPPIMTHHLLTIIQLHNRREITLHLLMLLTRIHLHPSLQQLRTLGEQLVTQKGRCFIFFLVGRGLDLEVIR